MYEDNVVRVIGTSATGVNIAVGNSPGATRLDHAWGADMVPANEVHAIQGTATVYAGIPGATDQVAVTTSPASTAIPNKFMVPPAGQSFTYDDDGNLTDDGVWHYTYDAENRLVEMTSDLLPGFGFNRQRLDFVYDYTGRRVQKTVTDMDGIIPTVTKRFLYNGWNLVAEMDSSGTNLLRSYTWGLDLAGSPTASGGVGALLQVYDYASGKTYWPTYDANGNVLSLVNASTGAYSVVYEYDPFGNCLRTDVNSSDATMADNPFRFSSKYSDLETGLCYYGNRFYSPTLGRFVNRDPIEEAGGINLYGFCGNDGVNRFDALGNSWLSKALKKLEHWTRKHSPGALLFDAPVDLLAPWGAPLYQSEEMASLAQYPWHTAQRYPQAAAVVAAIATWYLGGWGAAALGWAEEATTVAAGASAGFGGGFVGAYASGASLRTAFRAGYQGAAWGGGLAFVGAQFFHMNPSTSFSWKSAEWAFATSEIRYEVGRFAEHAFGITGWAFDGILEGLSFAGYELLGDAYHDSTPNSQQYIDAHADELNDDPEQNYIGGYGDRDPSTGVLFKSGGLGHFAAEFAFDSVDQVLQWQGLPDAGGLIAMAGNTLGDVQLGHSLGASRYANLAAYGVIQGGAVAALPFGMVAPAGVSTYIGDGDIITNFSGGLLFNPDATVLKVPFITGHQLVHYLPGMGL